MTSGEPGASAAAPVRDRVAANLRSCRAWVRLSQENVADGMQALGFRWVRQTVSEAEAGKRSLKAEEIHALAEVLGTTPERLIKAPERFMT